MYAKLYTIALHWYGTSPVCVLKVLYAFVVARFCRSYLLNPHRGCFLFRRIWENNTTKQSLYRYSFHVHNVNHVFRSMCSKVELNTALNDQIPSSKTADDDNFPTGSFSQKTKNAMCIRKLQKATFPRKERYIPLPKKHLPQTKKSIYKQTTLT